MRFLRVLAPVALLTLVAAPAAAWDGGALESSARKALREGDPAQAVADLRRATRSVLMPDVLEPGFQQALNQAHVAWLAKLATRAEALPTPEALRKVLALRDEAKRVKLAPEDQKVVDASVARVAARAWDELVAPPYDAGDLEGALREARALRYATGASEPREAAMLQAIRSRLERLTGPGASWLRQLLAHYYLRDADPTPLFPYEGSRVTKLDITPGACAGIAGPLRGGATAAGKGTAVAADLRLVSCTVQTATRASEKRLPYKQEVEVSRNFKVPREVTYACKVPKVVQQCVTSSYTSPVLTTSGRLTNLYETSSRTSCFPTSSEEDSTCRETVEEYVTTTHKEIRQEVELVTTQIKRTSLVVEVTGTISVDGIDYPSKLVASPFYEEESYTAQHSANQTYGSLRREELEKKAASELIAQLGESARRAIFERKAVALEAELAADGSADGPKRTERLTSIAFYRHAPPKELLTQMAATTAFAEASLLRAFEEGQIADRAPTTADAGDWLKLPSPNRDAESEVFADEERSLVVDKFSGVSTTALVTLGGHGGVGSPVYPTLGVVLRWDWTPSFLLLRTVSGSLFARPEGGMGPGNGFGYYGAQGGLSVTARTGPFSLQGMGMGGIDGRFVYGEGDDAGRPSMEVPASGFVGYGATLAVSGSRVIDHRLAITAVRKHRVEHTYPFSNTVEVTYGRGYHVGVHAEVWGDVLTSSVAHLPLSTWLAIGGSLDLGAASVGDVVESSEHEKK